jgi:hypothetical protein
MTIRQPIGVWEWNNNANDAGPNGYNLTVSGGSYVTGKTHLGGGSTGAFSYNGARSTTNSALTNLGSGNHGFAIWFYWNFLAGSGTQLDIVFDAGSGAGKRFATQIRNYTGNTLEIVTPAGTLDVTAYATANDWNHFAYLRSTTQNMFKALVNGTRVQSTANQASTTGSSALFTVTPSFSGTVINDQMTVWNSGFLTEDELREHWGVGRGAVWTTAPWIGVTVPTSPVATGTNGGTGGGPTISWTTPSIGSTPITYDLYKGTSAGVLSLYQSNLTASPYVDSGNTDGSTYYYHVVAKNAYGSSAASNEVSAVSLLKPNAPTGLSLDPGYFGRIGTFTAPNANGSGITSYKLYRGTSPGAPSVLVSPLTVTGGGATRTYNDQTIPGTHNTLYYYSVSAVNAYGEGPRSSEVSVTWYDPPAPAPVVTLEWLEDRIRATWTAPTAGDVPISSYGVNIWSPDQNAGDYDGGGWDGTDSATLTYDFLFDNGGGSLPSNLDTWTVRVDAYGPNGTYVQSDYTTIERPTTSEPPKTGLGLRLGLGL